VFMAKKSRKKALKLTVDTCRDISYTIKQNSNLSPTAMMGKDTYGPLVNRESGWLKTGTNTICGDHPGAAGLNSVKPSRFCRIRQVRYQMSGINMPTEVAV
jgi:hypothetical protein